MKQIHIILVISNNICAHKGRKWVNHYRQRQAVKNRYPTFYDEINKHVAKQNYFPHNYEWGFNTTQWVIIVK